MNKLTISQLKIVLIEMDNKRSPPPPTLPPKIEISKDFCLFHKGKIEGNRYTCPRCKTEYCLNCALKAKKERKSCIKCKQMINL
jgi:hypothetical protein